MRNFPNQAREHLHALQVEIPCNQLTCIEKKVGHWQLRYGELARVFEDLCSRQCMYRYFFIGTLPFFKSLKQNVVMLPHESK